MEIEARFDELLGLIYEAGMEPDLWRQFLECFSEAMQSAGTVLFVHDFANCSSTTVTTPDHSFVAHARTDEAFLESFQTYYNQVNVWLDKAKGFGEGMPVISSECYPDADLPKTEFFHGWLEPQNYFYSIGGSILHRGDVSVRLTALRSRDAGTYGEREVSLYRRLVPHLQRALRIHWRLLKENQARSLCETALERMGQAIALLDGNGKVLFANSLAEAFFRDGGGLRTAHNHFTARGMNDADNIRQCIHRACQGVGSSLRLVDGRTGRQRVITFMPLPSSVQLHAEGARVMAIIAEPGKPAGELHGFARLYGLSPAETRVLEQLLERESTREIAETLQISINTLRTQLRALFSKTQTKNQRELIKFFLSHPLLMNPDRHRSI